jgi:hypothetical protein
MAAGGVEVVVRLTPGLAADAGGESEVAALTDVAGTRGFELHPVHPGAAEPELARYLVAEVPDVDAGRELAEVLGSCAGVESAFVKPPAGPPGGPA